MTRKFLSSRGFIFRITFLLFIPAFISSFVPSIRAPHAVFIIYYQTPSIIKLAVKVANVIFTYLDKLVNSVEKLLRLFLQPLRHLLAVIWCCYLRNHCAVFGPFNLTAAPEVF